MSSLDAIFSRLSIGAARLMRSFRVWQLRFAKAAYQIAFSAVVALLLAPEPSNGQFRGLPAVRPMPGVPFTAILPTFTGTAFFPFGGSFSVGFSTVPLTTPAIPFIPQFVTMPGPPLSFPLFNFTGASGFYFGSGLFGGFGGFNPFFYPFFPFSGITGFSSFGPYTGFGGFTNFSTFNAGLGGFGGFAGKGFGGFNGRKPL